MEVLASPRSICQDEGLTETQLKVLELQRRGDDELSAKNFSAALSFFEEALMLLPDTPHLQFDRLRVYHELGDHEKCILGTEQIVEDGRTLHTDFELMGEALALRDASQRLLNVPPSLPSGFVLAPPGPRGRFVTCISPHKAGETLFSEAPLSTVIEASHFSLICHGCHRPNERLTQCSTCCYARFCDQCQQNEHRGLHSISECESIVKLRAVHPFSNEDISLGLAIFRIYKMIISSQTKAMQLLRLQSHRREFDQLGNEGHHFKPAIMASYLLHPPTIEETDDLFTFQATAPPWVLENLITLSAIHQTNSYRFRRYFSSPSEAEGGIFLQLAMFNHSCNPNCRLESENGHLCMTAVRDILPGEEITTNYLPIIPDLEERHNALEKLFFFQCDCGCKE